MKRFFKLSLCLLLAAVFVPNLASCDRSYDELEVYSAACELIPKSAELNDIFWGSGIPYVENMGSSNGAYYEANYIYLITHGFETVDELKEITRGVFSASYCEFVFSTVFSSINDGDGVQHLSRYYQKYADAEYKEPEAIMVYSYFEILLTDKVEYDFSTLRVTHSKREKVFVEIEATVTNTDGKTQKRTKQIAFVEEDAGWRIDSSTYLKYNEMASEYEDLENK